ncbi:MAG: TM2 domain-containing protein [Candidatus Nomurabacteria bacterium]|jgi:TM2 domain-containing membrane protein YozV|nr:TM2 domain-containing protein [Candidatus Nomurabacteria bacterium]
MSEEQASASGVHNNNNNHNNITVNVTGGVTVKPHKVNAIVYLLLAFFLGWLGVHRFLSGSIGMGILYLFTAGLFGIGWLVDVIMAITYLGKMDAEYNIWFLNGKQVDVQ